MVIPQGRLLYVLLNYKRLIFLDNFWSVVFLAIHLSCLLTSISLCCVVVLLSFNILIKSCKLFLKILIYFRSQFFNCPRNENAFALTTGFRFDNVHDRWVGQGLSFSHEAILDLLIPYEILALIVFLNFVEIGRVQPCVRKE